MTSVVSLLSVSAPAAPAMSATVPSDRHDRERDRDEPPAGQEDRLARDQALELAADAMSEPVKVIEPMSAPRTTKIVVSTARAVGQADEVVDGDERRRAAADRVEQRHQLRHRGHLHGARGVQARAAADQEADDDDRERGPRQAALTGEQPDERRDDGDDHAGGAQLVAAAPGGRRVHPVEAQHEAGRPPPARRGRRRCRSTPGTSTGSSARPRGRPTRPRSRPWGPSASCGTSGASGR